MNNRIREIRLEKGLSQQEFADRIRIHRNNLSSIETGARKPSAKTLSIISNEFGISKDWILTGNGEKYAKYEKEKEIAVLMSDLVRADYRRLRLMEYINRMDDETFERFASIVEHMAESMKK